jgi:hypothetical protein
MTMTMIIMIIIIILYRQFTKNAVTDEFSLLLIPEMVAST